MNPWAIAIIVAALILVVTIAIASFCSLTSDPQPRRHPSNWKPADRDGAS